MKKIILTLVVVFLLFTSCTSEETLKNDESSKISAVLKETNFESQKVMYQMLTKEEKHQIWIDKIDNLINDNLLNKNQIDLLTDLKSHFTVNIFDVSSKNNEKEIFKNIYVKDFLKKAQLLFSEELIYNNFYTINGAKVAPVVKPDCSCNQGSMWSCAGQSGDCAGSSHCTSTADGCGFATMFECNGGCYVNNNL